MGPLQVGAPRDEAQPCLAACEQPHDLAVGARRALQAVARVQPGAEGGPPAPVTAAPRDAQGTAEGVSGPAAPFTQKYWRRGMLHNGRATGVLETMDCIRHP